MPCSDEICIFLKVGLSEAVYVKSRGGNANGAWIIYSDGAVEVFGSAPPNSGGLATVTYPITLPAVSRYISIGERISADAGSGTNRTHISMIIDQSVTTSGFQARCQMSDGAISVNAFSWRVYCAPV
jgi:hypothetical protein